MVKQLEYMVCPLCGRNRIIETKRKGRIGWPDGRPFSLHTTALLQIRQGGGKKAEGGAGGYRGSAPGSGFHLVDGLTLQEMIDQGGYEDLIEGLKQQILLVIRQGVRIGWITKEDLGLLT